MKVVISKSDKRGKKYKVLFDTINIYFGASGYMDFIKWSKKGKALAQKKKLAYLARHEANEDWTNPLSAGFWSRWILWNKSTLEASIKHTSAKFGIKISLKTNK